jgi:CheY-like chemotaxis protein
MANNEGLRSDTVQPGGIPGGSRTSAGAAKSRGFCPTFHEPIRKVTADRFARPTAAASDSLLFMFLSKDRELHMNGSSEEGQGTTTRNHLPHASIAADTVAPPVAPALSHNETILVVEDDPLVRDLVITQLCILGYTTIAAADGWKALALVESGAVFDLLFTDVIMPNGINGLELASEVAKRRPGTKVLFTSGYTDNAMIHHGRLDQGVLLLSKPYRMSQLARMVHIALEGAGEARLAAAG